ncbi:PadR family transcriptional regulator [Roseovarius halotolerans]|uniref:Transcriptional regulator PadR-like family protein n=1 Tax=Roseovarius halotolerans TaxID=505353 RepID=A0A1X6YIQ8_9RHOB|nr:PadR family transcriptional regulator [Roseovarius halotolerans]RKT34508.1 PadR family transcriptional regulator [Roseovarius halotolerans]THF93664.1 MAG: PadR family transcriptional regulator [Sulfitobacter sp. SK025]SLN22511.1 Transcriptional regulator PadR-like family protein [Roseovarius halotolerans]
MRISGRPLEILLFLSNFPQESFAGYSLSKSLGISSGTLYPLLVKLEEAGLLDSQWEDGDPQELGRPRRRYYKVNGQGIAALNEKMRSIHPQFEPVVTGDPVINSVLGAK